MWATRRPARSQKTVTARRPSRSSVARPTGSQPSRAALAREPRVAERRARCPGASGVVQAHDHLGHDPPRVVGAPDAEGDRDGDGHGHQGEPEGGADPPGGRAARCDGVVGLGHPGILTPPAGRAGSTMVADARPAATRAHPVRVRPAGARHDGPALGRRAERGHRAPDGVGPRLPRLAALRRRGRAGAAGHAAIEYANRLLSGVVGLVAIGTWVVARRMPGAPAALRRWAAAAGACVVQMPLGAVTVLSGLHPLAVGSHFLCP